jgi:indole-3-acetaldehyde oxidase
MESIIAQVAENLGISQQTVREINIFTSLADREKVADSPTSSESDQYGALFAAGKTVADKDGNTKSFNGFPAVGIWMSLKKKVDFDAKVEAISKFNQQSRWRKRGISMTPVKYCVETRKQQCLLNLYTDGTCLITCDGTEIGQGLHTKMIQYAAYHLSQIVPGSTVPLEDIRVGPNGTDKVSHGSITGGSTTSEGVCEAVRNAVEKLTENLGSLKDTLLADNKRDWKEKPLTFKELVGKADGVQLQVSGQAQETVEYFVYGACCSEIEIDVLTGETVILSSSILYDCGKSLNPAIDLGQCEGGFMMGVGFFLREFLIQDSITGKLATDGTWEYKIPCFQDVPLKLDVEFFPRGHDRGIQSSKASGEPPLILASSVFMAVREAITAARKEFGREGGYRLDAPCTPRDIALLIGAGAKKDVPSSGGYA